MTEKKKKVLWVSQSSKVLSSLFSSVWAAEGGGGGCQDLADGYHLEKNPTTSLLTPLDLSQSQHIIR